MLHINMIQNVYNTDLGLMRRKTILEAMEWPEARFFFFFSLCAAAKLSRILNESSSCSKLSVSTK